MLAAFRADMIVNIGHGEGHVADGAELAHFLRSKGLRFRATTPKDRHYSEQVFFRL